MGQIKPGVTMMRSTAGRKIRWLKQNGKEKPCHTRVKGGRAKSGAFLGSESKPQMEETRPFALESVSPRKERRQRNGIILKGRRGERKPPLGGTKEKRTPPSNVAVMRSRKERRGFTKSTSVSPQEKAGCDASQGEEQKKGCPAQEK